MDVSSKMKSGPIELLAPAGNFEKLVCAVHFGADAIYLGGKDFSLRNFSGNFTCEEIKQAVSYAHEHGVKVYVAVNIYPRVHEETAVADFLGRLGEIRPDAVIIADPGIFTRARELIPHIPIHISTQANVTSIGAVRFWKSLGAVRVNTAREMSLAEIREISKTSEITIESFVHGAMCISYSGRCVLSSFLAGRESNRGMCAHPCRWKYYLMEETRPGRFMPVFEDDRGAYVFNSKDLCMIEHLPEMIDAGITAFKIEGRMKGLHYLAAVVKTYREALDACMADPAAYSVLPRWRKELESINNRGYCTGFYCGDPGQWVPDTAGEHRSFDQCFVGRIVDRADPYRIAVAVKNKVSNGDEIEIISRKGPARPNIIADITDMTGIPRSPAQPNDRVIFRLQEPETCGAADIVRKIQNQIIIVEDK